MIKKGCVFSAMLFLAACGGGGGGSSSPSSYQATAVTTAGGAISPGSASVKSGSSTTFTVTPAEGHSLKSVQGCAGSLQGSTFVTGAVTANCTITAVFSRDIYQVDVVSGGGGSSPITTASVLFDDTLNLMLTPDAGFQVDTVTGCGGGSLTGNNYVSVPIKSSCQLQVQFGKKRVPVTGLVAVGKPVANALIEAKCQGGSGFAGKVLTNSNGEFAADVPESDLPCALRAQIDGEWITTYHGMVLQAGHVNITPFTDLVLTLAFKHLPQTWYGVGSVADVLPLLPAAQAQLLAMFENQGYRLPASEFKPFDGPLAIGDEWDMLLDQLATGVEQTLGSSHESLVYDLLAGLTDRFPLPDGDKTVTAEACFNPVLFQPGTELVIKTYTSKATGGALSQNLQEFRYDNLELVGQGQNHQLTQRYQLTSCTSSDPSLVKQSCWTGFGRTTRQVNLLMKTDAQLAVEYRQDNSQNSWDQVLRDADFKREYAPAGNLIRYRFPVNVEYKEMFGFNQNFTMFTIYSPGKNLFGTTNAQVARTSKFIGIKTLKRGGKDYDVCEFGIREEKTVLADSTDPQTPPGQYNSTSAQYFLVGAGVDVTDTAITSIVINGGEVYSNPQPSP